MRNHLRTALSVWALVATALTARAQNDFVNWETPHVHPLELAPGGARLLAVNTADARLLVFDLASGRPVRAFDVPVGIDPVSVRARTASEVWVVNHVSDSVSIVDLTTGNVRATLRTDDEPCDVVFAGTPQRAYVSCSQANTLLVFDPANLAASPARIAIDGEDPRALAVSPDGSKVYCAIFDSGNSSTILGGGLTMANGFPPNVVSDASGPYGGQNPPPNSNAPGGFAPAQNVANPAPPRAGLIVKKNAAGQWRDDFTGDWTSLVSGANAAQSGRRPGWDLTDKDIAIVDTANGNAVTYARRLMNTCMALAVNPASGEITLVGTEATNEVRFEPVLRGKFVRVELARVLANGPTTLAVVDLNPHLTYTTSTIAQSERDKSLGDPRGIAWNAAGTKGYVAGMGSNNVVVIDANGARAGLAPAIDVAEGPTGIVVDDARGQLYVLAKFAAALCVVNTASETVSARIPFFDPSPAAIKAGRKHLYDTHANSGLGQVSCGSCHVDARIDHLAWDLGDPAGVVEPVAGNNLAAGLIVGGFEDFHPMKGPMTTQTLQDIVGKEPLHWRGDRTGLEAFNGAFIGLQGDDANLSPAEMAEFEDFLATLTFPPNPFRNFDNTLPTNLPLPGHFTTGRFGPAGQPLPNGNAQTGLARYRTGNLDGGALNCVTCHTLPTGAGTDYTLAPGPQYQPIPAGPNGEHHLALVAQDGSTNVSMKVPQLRNEYEKVGMDFTQLSNHFGFGILHDGSVDSIARFVNEPVFNLTSNQDTANMVAFMLAFAGSDLPLGSPASLLEPPGPLSKDTHAAVGWQVTLTGSPTGAQSTLIAQMIAQADANKVGLIVKGKRAGIARGWQYTGANTFQSDRLAETLTASTLMASASTGNELTYTVVPRGTQRRAGIDRDADGVFDRDELDIGSDPADPRSFAGSSGVAFCIGDGSATSCPCGNVSSAALAAGCVNSIGSAGELRASGSASLANDTIELLGAHMTASSFAIYVQGATRENGGVGIQLYDGLDCTGGAIVRLGSRTNAGGASSYPSGAGQPVSVRGGVVAPGTRTYQVFYRNAANFCTSGTANLTNGWEITWAP